MLRGVGCCWFKFENGQIFQAQMLHDVVFARNMLCPTVLRHVAFECCDRLAGECEWWASNVGISCAEILRSFGRGFTY